MRLLAINPGTQAEQHAELKPGMLLTHIGPELVTGLAYNVVIDMIKSADRPLYMTFDPTMPPPKVVVAAAPPSAPPTITPATAAEELQQHIVQHGVSDTATITRLREATTSGPSTAAPAYRVLQRSVIRAGFDMSSARVGELEVGQVLEVVEARQMPTGVNRVHFRYRGQAATAGWTSEKSGGGVAILQALESGAAEPASDGGTFSRISKGVGSLMATAGAAVATISEGGSAAAAAPGAPDPNGIASLPGESEKEYTARQSRLRAEASERMRQKFAGAGLGSNKHAGSEEKPATAASKIGGFFRR
jgi:hypothetical protein